MGKLFQSICSYACCPTDEDGDQTGREGRLDPGVGRLDIFDSDHDGDKSTDYSLREVISVNSVCGNQR